LEHVFDRNREREIARLHEHDFHVRDVRYFNQREFVAWRAGHWHHDWYNGRLGWWFEVGGVWYPYPAPIFPYPVVVAPLVVAVALPGAPLVPPGPAVVVAPLPAAPRVAYYCGNPAGFFPNVPACPGGWSTVPAQ
jgi:hypothetical protein